VIDSMSSLGASLAATAYEKFYPLTRSLQATSLPFYLYWLGLVGLLILKQPRCIARIRLTGDSQPCLDQNPSLDEITFVGAVLYRDSPLRTPSWGLAFPGSPRRVGASSSCE